MKILQIILVCTVILRNSRGAKNGDEGKPYEFGFTIDGEQHRHEKKDANGIIQGEFGFITADGIYHVTTYATDENGSFRILSMRNVRISDPLDGSGGNYGQKASAAEVQRGGEKPQQIATTQSPMKQSSLSTDLIPPRKANLVVQSTTAKAPLLFTTQPTIKPACASCGYVTLPPPTQKPQNVAQFTQNNQPYSNEAPQNIPQFPETNQPYNNQISQNVPQLTQTNQPYNNQISQNVPQFTQSNQPYANQVPQNVPGRAPQPPPTNLNGASQGSPALGPIAPETTPLVPPRQQIPIDSSQLSPQNPTFPQQSHVLPSSQNTPFAQPPPSIQQQPPLQPQPPQNVDVFAPSAISTPSLPNVQLPERSKVDDIKVENGMILVPNNPPIKIVDKYPGMVDGLPTGIEEKDIQDLLYKFNYTIGFHGHYEKGYRDGSKIGGYFVNGRDGISRVVTYVADEYGYRPKFKLVNLGLESPDTPKEGTEKNFGLKSFEFVWYPLK